MSTYTRRVLIFALLVVLALAYASFLTADLLNLGVSTVEQRRGDTYVRAVKYASVLVCALISFLIGEDCHDRRDARLLGATFVLICVADFFIGLREQFLVGVGVFFLVQLVFVVRHSRGFTWRRVEFVSAFGIYGGAAVLLLFLSPLLYQQGGAPLLAAGLLYGLVLSTSLWVAMGTIWRTFYPRTIDWFVFLGVLFFFFCDINIGLSQALSGDAAPELLRLAPDPGTGRAEGGIPGAHYSLLGVVFGIAAWYFYVPALVLLALSGYQVSRLRSIVAVIPDLPEPRGDGDAP